MEMKSGSGSVSLHSAGLKQLMNSVHASDKWRAHIGILEDQTARYSATKGSLETSYREKSAKTNAFLGMIHHFGAISGHFPARPWLDVPWKTGKRKILADALRGWRTEVKEKIIRSDFGRWFLRGVGFAYEEKLKSLFTANNWAPNAPATIRKKGSSSPLIDTGQLRRSISSEVVSK